MISSIYSFLNIFFPQYRVIAQMWPSLTQYITHTLATKVFNTFVHQILLKYFHFIKLKLIFFCLFQSCFNQLNVAGEKENLISIPGWAKNPGYLVEEESWPIQADPRQTPFIYLNMNTFFLLTLSISFLHPSIHPSICPVTKLNFHFCLRRWDLVRSHQDWEELSAMRGKTTTRHAPDIGQWTLDIGQWTLDIVPLLSIT